MSCLQKSRMQLPWGEFHAGGGGGQLSRGNVMRKLSGGQLSRGKCPNTMNNTKLKYFCIIA